MTVITNFEQDQSVWLVVAGAFENMARIPEQNPALAQTVEYLRHTDRQTAPPFSGLSQACQDTATHLSCNLYSSEGNYSLLIMLGFGIAQHPSGKLTFQDVLFDEWQIGDDSLLLSELFGAIRTAPRGTIFVIDPYWMHRLLMKEQKPEPGTLWRAKNSAQKKMTFEQVNTTPAKAAS